ncbi:hypothetical protein MLD38_037043 [Melastoma candidum]|uniref:Uncharacterized protein n=1 Tax=Melastoma candidum TaxID=119954 RepID=A0ACB9LLL9_9MYRT|nr:hypothetical protein MLD38_037043 [Melastoma candidum]
MSRNFLVRAFRQTATAPSSSDKPQYRDMSCHIRGCASSSLVSPLTYFPPLSSMPMPFNIPLPIPTAESSSKQEVLVPIEYQHRLSKRKANRSPDNCKMLHLNGGENSIGNSTSTLYIEVDVQNGGEPIVLIDDDESGRPRPSESKKRLKVLFTKSLKNSDVGCPGRIIVPKRKAEKHLPKLEDKTSIELVIRDILGSTSSWIVKYRSWSNSRSRMYIFEHTGDFVRENGMRAGDSITVYEDDCKNYYFSIKKVAEETRGTTGLVAVEPTNGLCNMEVPFVEKDMVHKGGEFEGIDPYLEGGFEWRVLRARIELSSWMSVGKLWEETCCRELGKCSEGLDRLTGCKGSSFGFLRN